MVEVIMAFLMIITGLCIGLAKIKYALKGDLPEIATTLFLVMGWFQASVHVVEWVELMMKFSLTGATLTAFIGLTSLLLTGLSLFFIQLVGSKIRVVC
ncbi:MAG: hypothetical protein ACI9T7_002587 [Oleiphilaceae bacterium]|jgi:hypothetical protein